MCLPKGCIEVCGQLERDRHGRLTLTVSRGTRSKLRQRTWVRWEVPRHLFADISTGCRRVASREFISVDDTSNLYLKKTWYQRWLLTSEIAALNVRVYLAPIPATWTTQLLTQYLLSDITSSLCTTAPPLKQYQGERHPSRFLGEGAAVLRLITRGQLPCEQRFLWCMTFSVYDKPSERLRKR